jgi:soluble lytic murein transglycosylase-like protein
MRLLQRAYLGGKLMSIWPDNLLKQQISPIYTQSVIAKTPSSKSNTAKTGDQTSSINAEKWAKLMKQNLMVANNANKSYSEKTMKTADDTTYQKYCDAMVAQQIKEENDFNNQSQTQLLVLLKDARNTVVDLQDVSRVVTAAKDKVPTSDVSYDDVSEQNTYDTNLKQQQMALYKKQMYVGTDVSPNNPLSGGNVDSWVSQAINQTGVGADWTPAIKWIINMESSGNPNAQNPNSTAYGLMQILDNTWGQCGSTKTSNPVQQVVAGIDYIKQRYGTADNAKAFWQQNHWY